MNILFQAYYSFLLILHYLIIILFFSYINSVFMNIPYVSTSDGHDDVCTCVFTTPYISDGLQWLHVFMASLLLFKFRRMLSFLLNGHGYFLSLRRDVSYSCGWICLHKTSSFSLFHPLYLRWTGSLICWIWPCPCFQRYWPKINGVNF